MLKSGLLTLEVAYKIVSARQQLDNGEAALTEKVNISHPN